MRQKPETLLHVDLSRDPAATRFIKDETVGITFARSPGEIISSVGPNRYAPGDALVTGSNGDRWSVSRERFEAKYLALPPTVMGQDGNYRARPVPVFAKEMQTAFSIARSSGGDTLQGEAHDWLLQYAPGDYGVVDHARFKRVYRRMAG